MDAKKILTQKELAMELENISDEDSIILEDENTGYSDDSIDDRDFVLESDSKSSDNELSSSSASSSEEDPDDAVPLAQLVTRKIWDRVQGNRLLFNASPQNVGVDPNVRAKLAGKSPVDFFNHFIDDETIDLFVTETNRFAAQRIASAAANPNRRTRLPKWVDTESTEMRRFLGIILWMGLLPLPQVRDYWSTKTLYQNRIPHIMSRNRFEGLLGMFHVSDNETARVQNDRLYKISNFLNLLQDKFKSSYTPEEDVCIDESNVPFRGRIYFRQYIPNKRHRYGIKLFKLCISGGYTWAFKVYTGKEKIDGVSVSEKVVMELMEGVLDSGRTLYTDNWYTSVSLSKSLIDRKTHLVGTMRANRKGNPQDVVKAKLKKGEVIAKQNEEKTVVLKWKDKRDVMMLSTKHDDTSATCMRKGKEIVKPQVVVDYNKGKSYIDLSDQMAAYAPFLRRTTKWYKRLLFHLITATTIVNSLHLFQKINNKKMNINKFKEAVVLGLIETPDSLDPSRSSTSKGSVKQRCVLSEVAGQKRVTRKRCSKCYHTMSISHNAAYGRKNAKKVNTICVTCGVPMCIPCFQKHLV